MEKKSYGCLDVAKFISALLVIAIHCAPFIEVDETLNFVFVQIIARLAVPFFFVASGWLFFQKIDSTLGWKDEANLHALKHYEMRILKLYLVWSVLYLPLLLVSWIQGGFDVSTILRLIRDVLCNGTYYHLWFLPALLLGVPLVYLMITCLKKHIMLWLSMFLYLLGMLMNVYGGALSEVPIISQILAGYEAVFVTSRNGLFFAPIYLVLGIYAKEFITGTFKKQAGIACLISLCCLFIEAFLLRQAGIMHDLTSMYFFLVPTIFFLFIFLMQFTRKSNPFFLWLRQMSLLLYVSHIYFIFLFLHVLQLGNLLVYGLTILCSMLFAYGVITLSKRYPQLKVLM